MPVQITVAIADNTDQMWGVQYARQEANKNVEQRVAMITAQNEQIAKQNEHLKDEFKQPLQELPLVHTNESYLQLKIDSCIAEMTQNMLRAAENNLIQFAKSLPKEVLAQVIAQAGAPPLIKE